MGAVNSFFTGTDEIVEAVRDAYPRFEHIKSSPSNLRGENVRWFSDSPYVIKVSVDRIHFMEGNTWSFPHAAGVLHEMRVADAAFEIPAARVHRITAGDVKDTQSLSKKGQLDYEWSMTHPWTKDDIGTYKAQLIDGNHRAAAAMALGEPWIYVYVTENTRNDVRVKDWVSVPGYRRNPARRSLVDGWWAR